MWPAVSQHSVKGILNQKNFLLLLLANLALQSLCQPWMHDHLLDSDAMVSVATVTTDIFQIN